MIGMTMVETNHVAAYCSHGLDSPRAAIDGFCSSRNST